MEVEAEHEAPPPHHDHQTWESFTHALHSTTAGGIEGQQSGTMFGWHWLDQDFNSDDMYRLDLDLLDTTPPSASTYSDSPTPSHHQPTDQGTSTAMGNSSMTPASLAWRRLPALIAEMQQRLETLESGSWLHDNDARSFDRYPIGTVLRLSQEFGGLAGQVLGLAATYGADSMNFNAVAAPHPHMQEAGSGPLAVANNTATVLLVLGGYLSLVRLYGLVLGHFHERLSRIPCGGLSNMGASHGPRSSTMVNANPTLQLGELPRNGTMPDVNRIHAALGMLLTALHHVEEQVGKGGEVARDMAVALLTDGGGPGVETLNLRNDLGDLGEKVRSVKELLREKMGL